MSRSSVAAAAPLALCLVLALPSCGGEPPEAEPTDTQTDVPEELATPAAAPTIADGEEIGTPREERVATLGLINKRNNESREIEMSPGDVRRIGDVVLRLATCERSPPWENPPETGAFVQVDVRERSSDGEEPEWRRVFSGWLFKNSPALNVVEHPIYDVWIKDCAMSFPGEEEAETSES